VDIVCGGCLVEASEPGLEKGHQLIVSVLCVGSAWYARDTLFGNFAIELRPMA
jgi:hypothetical protein